MFQKSGMSQSESNLNRKKPQISQNSISIAQRMKKEFDQEKLRHYNEVIKTDTRRPSHRRQTSEDQIGGQAKQEEYKKKIKQENKKRLHQWHNMEKSQRNSDLDIQRSLSNNMTSSITDLHSIPEEVNTVAVEQSMKPPQGTLEKVPLLSIDVNFGPEMHDKITVYQGDDLKQLANEFKTKNGLTKMLESKLLSMLQEQVKNLE